MWADDWMHILRQKIAGSRPGLRTSERLPSTILSSLVGIGPCMKAPILVEMAVSGPWCRRKSSARIERTVYADVQRRFFRWYQGDAC